MAIGDLYFNFSDAQALSGTSATNSTNVYDAGSAKKIFQGGAADLRLIVTATGVGGTTPTLSGVFVGSAAAALTTPTTLASFSATSADAAGNINVALTPNNQTTAFRYYGIIYTMAGTSPVATVNAELTMGLGQTNNIA